MNVGVPNSAPSYHKMSVEEYKRMSFVPTEANLERRRIEQEEAALQSQQQGDRSSMGSSGKDSLSTATSTVSNKRLTPQASPQAEVRRVSGNFNAPTHVEVERHKETSSPRGFRETIRSWVKKSPPPTVA